MKFDSVFKSTNTTNSLIAFARNKKFPCGCAKYKEFGETYITIDIGENIESDWSCTCYELKDKVDSLIVDRKKISIPLKFMMYPYNPKLRMALGLVFDEYNVGFNFS